MEISMVVPVPLMIPLHLNGCSLTLDRMTMDRCDGCNARQTECRPSSQHSILGVVWILNWFPGTHSDDSKRSLSQKHGRFRRNVINGNIYDFDGVITTTEMLIKTKRTQSIRTLPNEGYAKTKRRWKLIKFDVVYYDNAGLWIVWSVWLSVSFSLALFLSVWQYRGAEVCEENLGLLLLLLCYESHKIPQTFFPLFSTDVGVCVSLCVCVLLVFWSVAYLFSRR